MSRQCDFEQLPDGRVRCRGCGWESRKPVPITARRNCDLPLRTLEQIRELAGVCIQCDYLRPTKHGARCTHKACGCLGPEYAGDQTVIHGVAFGPQLVNLLSRRPSCPDGRW